MTTRALVYWLGLMMAGSGVAQDKVLVLQNSSFKVDYNTDSGRFSLAAKPSGQLFVTNAKMSVTGSAKVTSVTHKTFGAGEAIVVSGANGNRDSILVFPNLPFVLFRSALHNDGGQPSVTKQFQALSAPALLGKAASELRALGTGGLLPPGKNPGSYVWLALADPESRRGIVAGWLTQERGSGVVFTRTQDEQVAIEAQIDYGRLRLAPGQTEELETFALGYFEDARIGLETWADAVAKIYEIKLPAQPAGYCTWYSKPYGGASDEKHLAEQSIFAAKHLAPFGFSVIQIDDHWQAGVSTNGPKRNFTTHAAKGPYPGGMKAAAEQVKSLGLVPGLWFMPFASTYYDPFFAEHQDWFVKREDGRPYETAWGGTCLDMTHPGAREYLRGNIRRFAQDWGYDYFKMDGLWTGTATKQQYVNEGYKADGLGDAVLSNPEKTNLEAYRDGLKLVREAAGRKIFFLGCCAPQNMRSYGGAFGLVDAMRIGPDNGANWGGLLRGPTFGTRHYFLHGRVWYNDPDPVYVRADMPLKHAQLICSWVAVSGQLNLNSEWLPGLPAERLEVLKRSMPSHGLLPRPVDLFDAPLPSIWLLTDARHTPRRDVVALFNWNKTPRDFDYAMERIGLDSKTEYAAFDYWSNSVIPSVKARLQVQVPGESCRILALRPPLPRPQLLSTSRHVTQGMVDLVQEEWRDNPGQLQGRSKVVAGDPYELRILASGADKRWSAETAQVSPEDQKDGVAVKVVENGALVRVRIESPVSREVSWSVRFKSGN